jgi:hypothetical protein
MATKVWNHVAFWDWEARDSVVLAIRKTAYAETCNAPAVSGQMLPDRWGSDPEALLRRYRAPDVLRDPWAGATWSLPETVEDLCGLACRCTSYVQLVAPFPGDAEADRIEACFYRVKEWGSARTPAPLLQKYVGRIHYVCPERPPPGIRLAQRVLGSDGRP